MTILHFQCLKDESDRPIETQAMLDGLGLQAGQLRVFRPFARKATNELFDGVSGVTIGGAGWSPTDDIPYYQEFLGVLREAFERRVPMLGICFGAQTLAHLFGGKVILDDPRAEYGTIKVHLGAMAKKDPLFSHADEAFLAQSWHHHRISTMPKGALPLAWSQDGAVLQAFVFEDAPTWGVQFHPERTAETFGSLLETRERPSADWPIDRIRASLKPSPEAQAVLSRFAALCGKVD